MLKLLECYSLLYVDSNLEFLQYIISFLGLYFKEVYHTDNLNDAKNIYSNNLPDIIITDIYFGQETSIGFIANIRESNENIPIIIISEHTNENILLEVIPLQLTAYLVRPLNFESIINTLKKCETKLSKSSGYLVNVKNNIYLNKNLGTLIVDGINLKLNKKERLFVEFLIKNKKNLLTKDMIAYSVWGEEHMSDSALKNFILRIRKRFGNDFIYTVSNVGYTLTTTTPPPTSQRISLNFAKLTSQEFNYKSLPKRHKLKSKIYVLFDTVKIISFTILNPKQRLSVNKTQYQTSRLRLKNDFCDIPRMTELFLPQNRYSVAIFGIHNA